MAVMHSARLWLTTTPVRLRRFQMQKSTASLLPREVLTRHQLVRRNRRFTNQKCRIRFRTVLAILRGHVPPYQPKAAYTHRTGNHISHIAYILA